MAFVFNGVEVENFPLGPNPALPKEGIDNNGKTYK